MSEITLAKPLSGAEVRHAIIHDLDEALQKDDRFAGHVAYDGFSYCLSLTTKFPTAMTPGATRVLAGGQNLPPSAPAESISLTTERDVEPPNQVRVETDQPVPVLSSDGNKTQEKWVKHSKPQMKPGVPKNTVVGGGVPGIGPAVTANPMGDSKV